MGEKEQGSLNLGFKLFVLFTEIIVLAFILGGAWLINKVLLAPPLIIAFRLARIKIETKYDVFHCATVLSCMAVSTLICWLGLYLSLPVNISLISNIIVGMVFAIGTWHIQDAINFKRNYTFKDDLISKCKAKGYNDLKTQIAIKFFVNKEKPKTVWEWLCETQEYPMSWDSVKNLKYKMKKDLFL
jgi:hypothetical protein